MLPFPILVAQVLVSEETAHKLRSKHGLDPAEIVGALLSQPALLGRRVLDGIGTRVLVQVRVRKRRVLVVLRQASEDVWHLANAYMLTRRQGE